MFVTEMSSEERQRLERKAEHARLLALGMADFGRADALTKAEYDALMAMSHLDFRSVLHAWKNPDDADNEHCRWGEHMENELAVGP